MISRETSDPNEKPENQRRKSSKCWFYSCFSQTSFSDSELDSDSEYVVINHSVFKIPKNLQVVNVDDNLNPVAVGSSQEPRTVIVQRGSEKKVGGGYYKRNNRKTISEKKCVPDKKGVSPERKNETCHKKSDLDEKVYQYIRMKTYERMNPYEMTPNEFLNNISSVFVDNIKDPIPKDPLNRPRIFNRYYRKKKKTETQLMYEKAKEKEREKYGSDHKSNFKSSDFQSLRKPTISPAVMSDTNKNYGEYSLGYKAAIEQEDKGKEYEEKVLIWKIVVSNDENETKE